MSRYADKQKFYVTFESVNTGVQAEPVHVEDVIAWESFDRDEVDRIRRLAPGEIMMTSETTGYRRVETPAYRR